MHLCCDKNLILSQYSLTFEKTVSRDDGPKPELVEKPRPTRYVTPLKTNMDTRNDGWEKVTPFKHGHFGYLC